MNIKDLKPFELDKLPWWEDNKVYDFLWKIYNKLIYNPAHRLEHHWSYLKVLRHDYDWEAHSIFRILHHKLSRVRVALENGHAIHEEPTLKALNLAIKLAYKLDKDDYSASYNRYEKKWGELETWTTPIPGRTSVFWHSQRKHAIFEKDKTQEREEHLIAMYADEARKQRDRKIFFSILAKYLPSWWD